MVWTSCQTQLMFDYTHAKLLGCLLCVDSNALALLIVDWNFSWCIGGWFTVQCQVNGWSNWCFASWLLGSKYFDVSCQGYASPDQNCFAIFFSWLLSVDSAGDYVAGELYRVDSWVRWAFGCLKQQVKINWFGFDLCSCNSWIRFDCWQGV